MSRFIMKPILLRGLLACVLIALAGCHFRSSGPTGYSTIDFRYSTNVVRQGQIDAGLKRLVVDHRQGRVRIIGTEDQVGEWSWALTVRARDEESAIQAAAAADLRTRSDTDRLELTLSLPGSDGRWQFESELEIRLPKAVAVRTVNRFGATEITGVAGEVEVRGQNGPVVLRELAGRTHAETSFGSLNVREVGSATLMNRNGPIEVEGVQGAVEAETSFGSIIVKDVHGPVRLRNRNGSISGRAISGSVSAETSFGSLEIVADAPSIICRNRNGSIQLQALSGSLTNLEAETSFGRLEVQLPRGLKPMVEARTSFGKIESDFPIMPNPPAADPFASAEPGTPRVSLRNQNGDIRVSKH
jgi:hypothetical protein